MHDATDQPRLCLAIQGIDCAEEVVVLKRALAPLVGGEDRLAFDLLRGKVTLALIDREVTAEEAIQAVARTGMRAGLWREQARPSGKTRCWPCSARTVLTAASGLLGLAGLIVHAWAAGGLRPALAVTGAVLPGQVLLASRVLYALGILAGGWYVLPKAWHAATRLQPDMNLLMTVAVVGAVAIGQWFEAATVAFLFSLSLLLESWSVGRARRAIATLLGLAPLTARRRDTDGSEKEVPPEQIAVGALFVVRPGEKIPLDGRIVQGTSDVNQAPITGESLPAPKGPADEVFAGTINGDGALEVECTRPAADTTLARIIRMIGEAQSRRAPSEQRVERFARLYTPIVMVLAGAVLMVPPLLLGGNWLDWFYRALVLLVIACPCALVISTPVSIVAALARAAHHGVLVKGGVHMETPARLQAIAMDKTGTLTVGNPTVVDIVPLSGHDQTELLQRAAAMEAHSNHPLARAIVAAAKQRGVDVRPAHDFEIIQGKGARARLGGKRYWLGSHRYLAQRNQETPEVRARLEQMSRAGRAVVIIGQSTHVCGFITLADALRPGIDRTLEQLRAAQVRHLVMLTGDNQGTAEAVARQAGVDEVHAELLPEDKVRVVEMLVARYGSVAMVGDGVNDAPALARATLGIAMGAAGSDAAIETADIALMADDLSKLPWLIRHSRRTLAIIQQNITLALAVKALFVALTLAGWASLWAAIIADTGASLLVIGNGLRLLRD